MIPFTENDWYWRVVGKPGFWSSAAGDYVPTLPVGWHATAEDAEAAGVPLDEARLPSYGGSEEELSQALRKYGLPGPVQTQADYADAIQAHVDAAARSRSYADAVSLASYVASTVPVWAAEAQAFVSWRDAVWMYAHTELGRVLAGERAQPTVSALVAELPAMTWPE